MTNIFNEDNKKKNFGINILFENKTNKKFKKNINLPFSNLKNTLNSLTKRPLSSENKKQNRNFNLSKDSIVNYLIFN